MNKILLMTEAEFLNHYRILLDHVMDALEYDDSKGVVEMDYADNVLSIANDKGIYIINKQPSVKEIWLSSPVSGPHHFRFSNEQQKWLNKSEENLLDILSSEFKIEISNYL